jgi:acyl carrier protein
VTVWPFSSSSATVGEGFAHLKGRFRTQKRLAVRPVRFYMTQMTMMPTSPVSGPTGTPVTNEAILGVVLEALRNANLARDAAAQLPVSPDAPIFGPGSPLDSLGLVALLFDVEEGLAALGCAVLLSDERAMSQKRSPFRSVPALVDYVGSVARP